MNPTHLRSDAEHMFVTLVRQVIGTVAVFIKRGTDVPGEEGPPLSLLVVIQDEHFAHSSMVVASIFHGLYASDRVELAGVALDMRRLRVDDIRQGLSIPSEWTSLPLPPSSQS